MKNSEWFILFPIMLIAIDVFEIVNAFFPTDFLPNGEYFDYFLTILSVSLLFFNAAILIYYKQSKGLIYCYGIALLTSLLTLYVSSMIKDGSSYSSLSLWYGIIGMIHLIMNVIQIILAYRLTHPRLRFWFRLIHVWQLGAMIISFVIPDLIITFIAAPVVWPYYITPLISSGLYCMFYLELPKIKTAEEEEEEINPDDLLSRRDLD